MSKSLSLVSMFVVILFVSTLGIPLIDAPVMEVNFALAEEAIFAPDPASAAYGARPLGLGGAFVALADDTNSIFTNPAGLSSIDDWSFTSMSTQLLQKIDYTLAGGAYKIGPGTFGIGYIGTSSPAGYKTEGGVPTSTKISFDSTMAILSYGVNLANIMDVGSEMGDLSVGISAKVVSKGFTGIEDASATGFDIDLGTAIRPDNSPFAYGAAIKNLGGTVSWTSGSEEKLEQSTKVGVATKLLGKDALYDFLPGDLTGEIDLELLSGGKPMVFHIGAEYRPLDILALRVGLDQDPLTQEEASNCLTAGVGVVLAGFSFDYAYRSNPDAAELSNHYFSLSFAPEVLRAEKAAEEDSSEEEVKVVKENGEEEVISDNVYELPEEYQNISLDY
jgi:hypothetical protein